MKLFIAAIALCLAACTSIQTATTSSTATVSIPAKADVAPEADHLASHPLLQFVHDDLMTAAAYAERNGYPAVAGVYRAWAAQKAAIAAQLDACKAAIKAALPIDKPDGTVGAVTLYEMARERVAQGISHAVRVLCGVIALP